MVTASQLVIPHSSIASLVPMVSNVHVKLDDTNYLQWHFQMNLLLECHGILGFVTGSHPCPPQFVVGSNSEEIEAYKVWQLHDKALMLLLSTTLFASAISCVIGSTNAREMWLTLKERFAIITKPSIFLLKTCLYNMKKGLDSIAQYLNHIKDARDQLSCVGVHFADEDIIILALNGLPTEYNTFRGSPYHSPGRATTYYSQESRSCNATVLQSIGHQEILFTTSASTVPPLPIKTVFSTDAFAKEEATVSPIGSPISKLQLSDEIIAPADVVLPQIPTSSIVSPFVGHAYGADSITLFQAITLHDGKAFGSHDEGETGKTVISGNDKFAGDIPLVTPKLHFDRISHFDLNVVPDIQIYLLANDIDYDATVLLVVPLTIVSFILALAGGFQWKLKHMAQPPGFTEPLHLVCTLWFSVFWILLAPILSAYQFADILTNGLSTPLFQQHCSNVMLGSSKHAIEGGCKDINCPSAATCKKIEE
ncbi:hypothetical protein L3X38_030734 [Prunus dulcis]|uniref:Retrotransposon Copia-like N-terminal domain-containing protein n=1 Tax=Prunus dulcis TaxID=3755 RepID=A0AAD4VB67_PRUDU|nr:hypothetical protein L3X38_030734 [Prunus dulcis]